MVDEPNQGAAGDTTETDAWATGDAGSAGAGAPINQGAAGAGPEGGSAYEPGAEAYGESPLTAEREGDPFSERPELFVGAAFAGGFALAQLLKRVGS